MYRGKEKLLSFGPYPKVSLLNARDQRDAAKAVLREGRDPAFQKRIRKAIGADVAHTFEAIARGWHARSLATWTERHGKDVLDSLRAYVFPTFGRLPINGMTAPMVLGC